VLQPSQTAPEARQSSSPQRKLWDQQPAHIEAPEGRQKIDELTAFTSFLSPSSKAWLIYLMLSPQLTLWATDLSRLRRYLSVTSLESND